MPQSRWIKHQQEQMGGGRLAQAWCRPAPCSPHPAPQHLLHRAVASKPPTLSSLLQRHLETPLPPSSTLSIRQGRHLQGYPRPASGCTAPSCCHCRAGAQEPTWQLSQSRGAISQPASPQERAQPPSQTPRPRSQLGSPQQGPNNTTTPASPRFNSPAEPDQPLGN